MRMLELFSGTATVSIADVFDRSVGQAMVISFSWVVCYVLHWLIDRWARGGSGEA